MENNSVCVCHLPILFVECVSTCVDFNKELIHGNQQIDGESSVAAVLRNYELTVRRKVGG
jgi:hypothetical protein